MRCCCWTRFSVLEGDVVRVRGAKEGRYWLLEMGRWKVGF